MYNKRVNRNKHSKRNERKRECGVASKGKIIKKKV
jgi:hypothetical protein